MMAAVLLAPVLLAPSAVGPGISPPTLRAKAFVLDHQAKAAALGARSSRLTHDPDELTATLRRGLAALGDPEYLAGQRRVTPGIGSLHGVRLPLLDAVAVSFRAGTKGVSTDQLLLIADRLLRDEHQEPRWLAMGILERVVTTDPERSWQLIRQAAREAGDWIAIDTLAHAAGRGVLAEPYRWAELDQLAFSPSRWERRLIGSTTAIIPFMDLDKGRRPEIAVRGIELLAQLIGDAEPEVQQAISWAYRSLLRVDAQAVEAALAAEAAIAAATNDGHRAWVIRDTCSKLTPAAAEPLRAGLAGIRRRAGTPSTSRAARIAADFGMLPDPAAHPEPRSSSRRRLHR